MCGNFQNQVAHSNIDAEIARLEEELARLRNMKAALWHNRYYQGDNLPKMTPEQASAAAKFLG
jgi:hypothetical protein